MQIPVFVDQQVNRTHIPVVVDQQVNRTQIPVLVDQQVNSADIPVLVDQQVNSGQAEEAVRGGRQTQEQQVNSADTCNCRPTGKQCRYL